MDNILDKIGSIYNRIDIINRISIVKKTIKEKDAQRADNYRKYVREESGLLSNNEQLVEITPDGNCEFRALSQLVYDDISDDSTHRVRREICRYLIKITIGEKYVSQYTKLFTDLIIENKELPKDLENIVIDEMWINYIGVFEPFTDFDFIKNYNTNIHKVLGIICTFMKGLPEIDKLITITPNDENAMFKAIKTMLNMENIKHKLKINKIESNADVQTFIDKVESMIQQNINIDDIINQDDNDTYEDIIDNQKQYNIDEYEDENENTYYKNLSGYIQNKIIKLLKASLEILPYPPTWGDGSLIPSMASQLYNITLCLHQIFYDGKTEYYKSIVCTISKGTLTFGDETLINPNYRKMIFYNFLNAHFDAIKKVDL